MTPRVTLDRPARGRAARAAAWLLMIVATMAAVTSCATRPRTYYEPAKTRARAVSVAQGEEGAAEPIPTQDFVPTEFARENIRIACESRIAEEEPIGGVVVAKLHVRIWVHNYSRRRIELRPGEFSAEDDAGRAFRPSEQRLDGEPAAVMGVKAPARASIDVVFRLPAGYDVRGSRSLKLRWGFRIDEREYRHETIFEATKDRAFRDPFAYATSGR